MPSLPDVTTASLASLIDLNFLLINRIVALLFTLLFFSVVLLVKRSRGMAVQSSVPAAIKLSLFGMLLLVCEMGIADLPSYRAMLEQLQVVVILLCLARVAIYVVVDIYLRLHIGREVPSFIRDTVRLVVYLAVGVISLRLVFKIDLSAVVTTTTVLTAMIAFAMQNTLANALSGFSIQSDKLLDRHNWIAIREKGIFGEIVNVGFRYTTLRTLENTLLMVPNSLIMQSVVTHVGSSSSGDKPANQLEIMLGYDVPPEAAKQLLLTLLQDEPLILSQPEPVVRLQALNDSGITYLLKFWIDDPACINQVRNELLTKSWYAVNRAGYSFPFPHRQLVTGEVQQPFNISTDNVAEILTSSEIFSVIDHDTLKALAEKSSVRVYGTGETVIRQGETGSSLYVVIKGELEVLIDGTSVGRLGQQAIFGEMSLLTGEPRSATINSCCESWLAEISKQHLEPLLRQNPALMGVLSAVLEEREQRASRSTKSDKSTETRFNSREEYLLRLKQFFRL